MPKLTIEHAHSLEPAEAKQRLDALAERLSAKYGIDAKWKSPTEATFKRSGASGTISVRPGKVVIDVDLSLVLSPMKSQVESRIRNELEKALA
jgi:putative polyhydroxyalkanoate system protein